MKDCPSGELKQEVGWTQCIFNIYSTFILPTLRKQLRKSFEGVAVAAAKLCWTIFNINRVAFVLKLWTCYWKEEWFGIDKETCTGGRIKCCMPLAVPEFVCLIMREATRQASEKGTMFMCSSVCKANIYIYFLLFPSQPRNKCVLLDCLKVPVYIHII